MAASVTYGDPPPTPLPLFFLILPWGVLHSNLSPMGGCYTPNLIECLFTAITGSKRNGGVRRRRRPEKVCRFHRLNALNQMSTTMKPAHLFGPASRPKWRSDKLARRKRGARANLQGAKVALGQTCKAPK